MGSFVTGCTRRNKLAIDAYLELDVSLGSATCADVVIMYNNKKMHPQCPSLKFFNYNVFEERDPLNQQSYVLFKNVRSLNFIKVYLMPPHMHKAKSSDEKRPVNFFTCGMMHANWMVQNLAEGGNNEAITRLLRIVREWKDVKGFWFLPTEVLDLTLSYASFGFKETGVFKVLLKFFTLVSLILCPQSGNFYNIEEFHQYIIDLLDRDQKNIIIKAAQDTFANLANNDVTDFMKGFNQRDQQAQQIM